MQIRWGRYIQEPHWRDLCRLDDVPVALRHWILTTDSLTQQVQARCRGHFHLEIIRHTWVRPQLNERRLLLLPDAAQALCREVVLCCDNTPLVFARTIIPNTTLCGAGRRLSRLGRKPLGELLFRDHSVLRSHWQVTSVAHDHSMFADIQNIQAKNTQTETGIWGRRSVFFFAGQPLLVSEMFLPSIGGL